MSHIRELILSNAQTYLRKGYTERPSPVVTTGLIYLGCLEDIELTRNLLVQVDDASVRKLLHSYASHIAQEEQQEQAQYAQARIDRIVQNDHQLRLIRGRKT